MRTNETLEMLEDELAPMFTEEGTLERAKAVRDNIEKLLSNEHLMVDDIWVTDPHYDGCRRVVISVSWGDWKHEHAYLRYLLTENGYDYDGYVVTEEDGSDCYSADHYVKVS